MTNTQTTRRPFELGRIFATPGACALLASGVDLMNLALARHGNGDWGDLSEDDRDANERALTTGARIFSAYQLPEARVWVITEADRSATTLLLPEEY